MLYSQLFGKTQKESPKDEVSKSAQLLIRAGFIHKDMAGVYSMLPLGLKVFNKVKNIVRQEMNAIGGQELELASLQSKELWEKTNRWDDEIVDVWFKSKLKNGVEVGLGLTHEEPLTLIASEYVKSYKDLPMYVYQIQNKFRNEVRAKSGIIRGREFSMKDLYSFNSSQEDLDQFYLKVKEAYFKIFNRLGIGDKTFYTFASGGSFSKYSHEFQTLSEIGEDTIYLDRKSGLAVNEEVYNEETLQELILESSKLEKVTSIETGNIFKLGTKFSEPLNLTFTDSDGNVKPVIMGSYGIGIGRAMGTVAEINSDEKGLVWNEEISPYDFHLVGLHLDNLDVKDFAYKTYKYLTSKGYAVLFDDRENVSPGAKFADADLIGIHKRLVVSKKTGDKVELSVRDEIGESLVSIDAL
jgi:prolyl-tRNA synthetase